MATRCTRSPWDPPAEVAAGGRGGPGGGGGGGAQFSDDSRWIGYNVNPPAAAGRGGARGGAPGAAPGTAPGGVRGGGTRGGAEAGAPAAARPTRRFELLELATGERYSLPNPASFRFSKGSRWLAVRLSRASGTDTSSSGADLILRDLSSGTTRNIGNVNLYDFNAAGTQLAYTVDAQEKIGNGIYLLKPDTGETQVLAAAAGDFDALSWSAEGANLAVLRGEKKKENKQKENVLLAWIDAGSSSARAVQFDPAKAEGFPKGMVLSEFFTPQWTKDGTKLFLGIKEQEPEPPTSTEPQANVDVWHWKDAQLQSEQIIRLPQERRATLPAAFVIASGKFVPLGDNDMRGVTPVANGKWGIGRNDAPYRGEFAEGSRADYYRVNLETGERTLISKGLTRTMGSSPDGKWFLYLKDKHVHAFNLDSARDAVIDAKVGQELRGRGRRSSRRKAGVRRGRLDQGWNLRAPVPQVRHLAVAARRRRGGEPDQGERATRTRSGSGSSVWMQEHAAAVAAVAAGAGAAMRRESIFPSRSCFPPTASGRKSPAIGRSSPGRSRSRSSGPTSRSDRRTRPRTPTG